MFKNFHSIRIAFGLAFFMLGQQLIFYFKERLGRGTEFTAACLVIALVMMIPPSFLGKRYELHKVLLQLLLGWLFLCYLYLYFYINPSVALVTDYLRENTNFIFCFVLIILLRYMPDKVGPYFIVAAVMLTLAANLVLFYSLMNNPKFILGMRATIFYGDGEGGGNPHVAARNAIAGFIASCILIKRNNLLAKILAYINLCASLAALVMAQVRTALLSVVVIVFLFAFFSFNARNIKAFGKSLTRPNNLIILGATFIGAYFLIIKTPVWELLYNYAVNYGDKFLDAMVTATGQAKADEGDASASYRVISFSYFLQLVMGNPVAIIAGLGYKFMFLDVPILEAITDCGILGFLLFGGFATLALFESYRAIRHPTSDVRTFMAYFFIPTFLNCWTSGRPFDTSYLFIFVMATRFLAAPPPKPAPPARPLAVRPAVATA